MVSTYCQSNSKCKSEQEVVKAVAKIEHLLGFNCFAMGQEEEDLVITGLKALRNIGFALNAESTVKRCFEETSNPMEIRLAALDFMRFLNCQNNYFQTVLMDTFRNVELDSELRIGSYLALMNCPTDETVQEVKQLLSQEEVNQGNLITTLPFYFKLYSMVVVFFLQMQLVRLCGPTSPIFRRAEARQRARCCSKR